MLLKPELQNKPLATNINLRNYAIEFIPTEYSVGATFPYTASHLPYKPCLDPGPYLEFESNFHFFSALFWVLRTTSGSKATRHFV